MSSSEPSSRPSRLETPLEPGAAASSSRTTKYYRSNKFKGFDPLTQADKRSVLDRFCQTAGNMPFAAYRKEDVEASQDKRRETPAATDKLVKYLRALFVTLALLIHAHVEAHPTAVVRHCTMSSRRR